jgi:hypothetical protein
MGIADLDQTLSAGRSRHDYADDERLLRDAASWRLKHVSANTDIHRWPSWCAWVSRAPPFAIGHLPIRCVGETGCDPTRRVKLKVEQTGEGQ